MALRNRPLGLAAQDMLQERPVDLLHQLVGVLFRQFRILTHALAMLPRRMGTATAEMQVEGRIVGADSPGLLNWFAALTAALANEAICAAIEQDLSELPVLDVLLDLWLFPESARTRPLEGNSAPTFDDTLR